MDIYEFIGHELLNDSDITDIVGTHIYHGLRPESGDPCINYFEVSYELLGENQFEQSRYQISCRASTPGVAQDLGRKVAVKFQNAKRTSNNFDIQMATVENKMLLPEPDTDLYHVPVDIRFLYSENIVS